MMSKKLEEILENDLIKEIINDLNLNKDQINSGLSIFQKIIEEQENANKPDFVTKVKIYDEKNVVAITVPNDHLKSKLLRNKYHKLSQITWINQNFKFDKLRKKPKNYNEEIFYWHVDTDKKNSRSHLGAWIKSFYKSHINKSEKPNMNIKGFYICGEFGTGKTTFLYTLTNYLIENEKTVICIKLDDLFNYLKTKFENSEEIHEINSLMKSVDVLLIDDIGNEKVSDWFHFSFLFPILDYRLNHKKICGFSSNFNYKELSKYYKKHREINPTKIDRLMNRIESLSYFIELSKITN